MEKNRIILLLVALAMLSAPLGAAASATSADELDTLVPTGEPQTNRYIVAFFTHPDFVPGDSYMGQPIVEVINPLKMIVVEVDHFPVFQAQVLMDENVRYVTWDDPAYATLNMVPNDYFYGHAAHWGSKRIGGEAAWDVTTGSTAVKVAMVDSGLNKGHEEYSGQARVLQGYDFANGDTDPEDSKSCNYHGTHTTGTAGATINNGKGIAGMSQHSILPVKIFSGGFFGCGTSTTAIVNALKYTGDQGAHVSSNSWGGGSSSSAINDAIAYAHNKGVTHVAAAGNSGPCTNCVGQPWKDNPSITIVVTSLTDGDIFSDFSSEGPEVDVIAPGDYIASSTSGTSDYHAMSGTSMATPHVAGVLALYIASYGNVGYSKLESALKSSAENLGFSSDRQGSGLARADTMLGSGGGGGGGTTYACDDGVDNDGDGLVDLNDPGCESSTDNDETDPATGGMTLTTSAYKTKGNKYVDLTWDGATTTNVDVYRDGALLTTTANDGAYTDAISGKGGGSYTYKVCEESTTTCSNESTATF